MAKKKYVITRKGCSYGEVGDEVDLTEDQARALVNKVEEKGSSKPGPKTGTDKKLETMTKERDSIQSKYDSLIESVEGYVSKEDHEKILEENIALADQVTELNKQLESKAK